MNYQQTDDQLNQAMAGLLQRAEETTSRREAKHLINAASKLRELLGKEE